MIPAPPTAADRVVPTRPQLFMGFFQTGLSGFGGVMPHARRVLVEDRRWLTNAQFTELLSLGQALPGPNVANMAVVVGARYHGWAGSLLAVTGLLTAPLVIVLALAHLHARHAHAVPLVRGLAGVAAGAAGLLFATAGKLTTGLTRELWSGALLAAAFLGVVWLRLPLPMVLLTLGPLGIACAWRSQARQRREAAP